MTFGESRVSSSGKFSFGLIKCGHGSNVIVHLNRLSGCQVVICRQGVSGGHEQHQGPSSQGMACIFFFFGEAVDAKTGEQRRPQRPVTTHASCTIIFACSKCIYMLKMPWTLHKVVDCGYVTAFA